MFWKELINSSRQHSHLCPRSKWTWSWWKAFRLNSLPDKQYWDLAIHNFIRFLTLITDNNILFCIQILTHCAAWIGSRWRRSPAFVFQMFSISLPPLPILLVSPFQIYPFNVIFFLFIFFILPFQIYPFHVIFLDSSFSYHIF